MKKALSIILALTLAFSLLPTFAFAVETETESAAPQAFSINFENIPTDTITPYKTTHAQYGKRWYIKIGDTFQGSNWKMLIDKTNSNAFENTKETTVQYYSTAYYVPLTITEEYSTYNTIAFEITTETSGIYNVSVIGRSSGSGVDFSASVNDIKIGEWNLHADKIGVAAGQKATCSSTIPVFLNKGANVLKIEQAIGGNGYFGFEFTPVDLTGATAEIILPETLTIGEKASVGLKLTVGEKTVILNEIPDDIDIVLVSDSSSVKTGEKTVAAYLEGTANITAEVTVNGVAFTTTKQIAVSKATEAKAFVLDFSALLSSIDLLYENNGNYYIDGKSTFFGSNWEAVTDKNVSTLLKSSMRIRYFKDSRIQVYAYAGDLTSEGEDDPLRDTMAFDIYVPADGIYDLSAVVWKHNKGGYASIYIDDVFVGKHDLYNETTLQNVDIDDYGKASLTAGKHRLKVVCAVSSADVSANPFCKIVFTPSSEDEALKEAFEVQKETLTGYVAPSVVSVSAGGSVITPEKNSDGSYDIEAAEENKDGAKFLYWAKGLTSKKKIVSFSNKLKNYVPGEANGAEWLIAVYDDMLPANDEYYNANGQLIATGEEPDLPSMAGYGEASDWKQYEETNIYVAEYNKTQPDDVTVTVNGETKTVPYGTEITCTATSANFKCWTKSNINGKTEIVSAENVYKFKAWEDCSVDAVNEAFNYNGDLFKIVIDSFNAGNETGIMAEFIGFGSNVVEKGIMWNDNKIAMTKPGTQFSIIADKNGEYKGYAVVKNGATYTLIVDGEVTLANAE